NPIMSDTLSKVVYLDLMDKDSKVIQSEVLPIKEGKISGAFVLPKELGSSDYFLRAYTEWMRNFTEKYIFLRALPVLTKEENIQAVAVTNPDLFGDLEIILTDSIFTRDTLKEMEFQLSFLDET